MKIWEKKDTITRLPEDPILLKEYMEKLPPEVIEQFVANMRREGEVLEEGENVDIVVQRILRSMRGND